METLKEECKIELNFSFRNATRKKRGFYCNKKGTF